MINIGGRYNKFLVAIVTAAIGWVTIVVTSASGKITSGEWLQGATMLAIALGVYAVANQPPVA